eukprot:m.234059 g.234059  ORF g.234059 m.234059 type:complete len:242 (+) comp26515_c0_seq8:211-936(+)
MGCTSSAIQTGVPLASAPESPSLPVVELTEPTKEVSTVTNNQQLTKTSKQERLALPSSETSPNTQDKTHPHNDDECQNNTNSSRKRARKRSSLSVSKRRASSFPDILANEPSSFECNPEELLAQAGKSVDDTISTGVFIGSDQHKTSLWRRLRLSQDNLPNANRASNASLASVLSFLSSGTMSPLELFNVLNQGVLRLQKGSTKQEGKREKEKTMFMCGRLCSLGTPVATQLTYTYIHSFP